MIAFETLLLGIIFGRVPIRVMVAPPVTTVEFRLDGASIGTLVGRRGSSSTTSAAARCRTCSPPLVLTPRGTRWAGSRNGSNLGRKGKGFGAPRA